MPDRSPYEQAALEYCAPRGIPLSQFLEVWSPEDQWAALEWHANQQFLCSGCGLDVRETVGPEHVDKWNAELTGHCDGCRAAARAQADLDGNEHPDQNAGARFRFWRDKEMDDGRVDVASPAVSET